jgi:hypothetical protein
MEADDLLCSRNARPGKALVGRVQWKILQPPSLRENEQAWRDIVTSFDHLSEANLSIIPRKSRRRAGRQVRSSVGLVGFGSPDLSG